MSIVRWETCSIVVVKSPNLRIIDICLRFTKNTISLLPVFRKRCESIQIMKHEMSVRRKRDDTENDLNNIEVTFRNVLTANILLHEHFTFLLYLPNEKLISLFPTTGLRYLSVIYNTRLLNYLESH